MDIKEISCATVDDLNIIREPAIYHIGIGGNGVISVYFKPVVESKKCYVFSPGYLNRKKFTHPYFQRLKWFDELDASGLIITDPTLGMHQNVGITWFQGSAERFAIFDILLVVEKFKLFLGLKNSNLLFFGSSAGGFASLMLATVAKGSCCIVNNPQTDIFRFREPFVTEMIDVCYPGKKPDLVRQDFKLRTSVVEFMVANENIPKCIYLQNVADTEHYENHFVPFMKAIGELYEVNELMNLTNVTVRLYRDEVAVHNPAVMSFLKPYFDYADQEFLL